MFFIFRELTTRPVSTDAEMEIKLWATVESFPPGPDTTSFTEKLPIDV